jgi:dUTP pyrophosphatase
MSESKAPVLKVKKLSENAKIPTRGSPASAGYDLYAAESSTIQAQGKALIKTDISIAIPTGKQNLYIFEYNCWFVGYYGRVAPRSSLSWKNHIDVGAGVIDEDYRGPVGVVLYNFANDNFRGVCSNEKIKKYEGSYYILNRSLVYSTS